MSDNNQAEPEAKKSPPQKTWPNLFFSIPIPKGDVRDRLIGICDKIIEKNPSLDSIRISPEKFHISLPVFHCLESEIPLITGGIDDVPGIKGSGSSLGPGFSVEINGLNSFGTRVLFAGLEGTGSEDLERLERLNRILRGILPGESEPTKEEFHPHLTLFKTLPPRRGKKKGVNKIERDFWAEFKDSNFGRLDVNKILLCWISGHKKATGENIDEDKNYGYKVVSSWKLS